MKAFNCSAGEMAQRLELKNYGLLPALAKPGVQDKHKKQEKAYQDDGMVCIGTGTDGQNLWARLDEVKQ